MDTYLGLGAIFTLLLASGILWLVRTRRKS